IYPLHITLTKPACGPQRIRMVTETLVDNGDGLKPTVRMVGKPGNTLPVVHSPFLIGIEVAAQVTALEKGWGGTHFPVSGRVMVQMIDTEQKRVLGLPRCSQRERLYYRVAHAHCLV